MAKKPINKTTAISIRLSAADKEMIQQMAEKKGVSVTDYILKLVVADASKNYKG